MRAGLCFGRVRTQENRNNLLSVEERLLCLARSRLLGPHRVPSSHFREQNRKCCSHSWEESLLMQEPVKSPPPSPFDPTGLTGGSLGEEIRCALGSLPLAQSGGWFNFQSLTPGLPRPNTMLKLKWRHLGQGHGRSGRHFWRNGLAFLA